MKYQQLFLIFLFALILVSDSFELRKPSKKSGRKGHHRSKLTRKKRFYPKKIKNTFRRIANLDVFIRFSFARYSSNSVAQFATGMLQAIYLPLFRRLRHSPNSKELVIRHTKCVDSVLRPFMTTKKQSLKFARTFLRKIGSSRKSFMNSKIFNYALKKWIAGNKAAKISNKLIAFRYRKIKKGVKNMKIRNILGPGVWLNVLYHSRYLVYLLKRAWFNSYFVTKKVMRCGIYASQSFSSYRRYFIIKYKQTKRVLCNINPLVFIVRLLRRFKLLAAMKVLFNEIAFKGIKMNKIHHLHWSRLARSMSLAYFNLLNECPA